LFAMAQVARLAEGQASILDRTLQVTGRAPSTAVADDIRGLLTPTGPEGFVARHELTTQPVPAPATASPAAAAPCVT
ncbi:hypothetical protein, partial [Acinetobacter baumannii]|uniref:hypothetical protein n=1 Tax=Acinetobacter baumannii TaxID=470 RepID=UPI0013D0454C